MRGGSAAGEQDPLPPVERTEPSTPPSVPFGEVGLVVASVTLTQWDVPETEATDVATWLGPGSPVQAASERPGARTVVERPFGAAGPTVTVVHVPSDRVEVVFSDARDQPSPGVGPGRITTVEVRHARARPRSYEALFTSGSVSSPAPRTVSPARSSAVTVSRPPLSGRRRRRWRRCRGWERS